jgi:hypothetical protein
LLPRLILAIDALKFDSLSTVQVLSHDREEKRPSGKEASKRPHS